VHRCWWRICRKINVFSTFEYHMLYIHLLPVYWLSFVFVIIVNLASHAIIPLSLHLRNAILVQFCTEQVGSSSNLFLWGYFASDSI
jgi:hypothetical protein